VGGCVEGVVEAVFEGGHGGERGEGMNCVVGLGWVRLVVGMGGCLLEMNLLKGGESVVQDEREYREEVYYRSILPALDRLHGLAN
jgi:hypothetical protein